MHSICSSNALAHLKYLAFGLDGDIKHLYLVEAEVIAAQFNSLSWTRCKQLYFVARYASMSKSINMIVMLVVPNPTPISPLRWSSPQSPFLKFLTKVSSSRTLFRRPRVGTDMPILPLTSPSYPNHNLSGTPMSVSNRVPLIFRRLHRFQQMDFELAFWQLSYLCLAPKRVYRNVYYHKQTKNTWARDDPAILILLFASLFVAAVAWSIVYSYSPLQAVRLAFVMVLRDYLLIGVLSATLLWFFANRVLVSPSSHSSPTDSSVEWAYAFDVHTNAFFPLYLTLYLAQLFLLPVVLKDNWVCLLLGNTLYLAGFAQYIYGVYLGLSALPFLIRSEILLAPLLPLFASYVVSLLGFHVAKHVLSVYFGS